MDYGQNIKAARKAAKLTQAELAEKCGLATVTVRQYESGKREPRKDQIQAIADVLGVKVWELMGFDGFIRVREPGTDLLPSEFNEFERFIESMGYYTRYDKDNGKYQIHKGKSSIAITPEELQRLVRASKATVAALIQDLIDNTPAAEPPEEPSEKQTAGNGGERWVVFR